MPPSSTIGYARQFGQILGLSEGLDGSSESRLGQGREDDVPEQLEAWLDATTKFAPLSDEAERWRSEIRALYLPSLLRTYYNTPVNAYRQLGISFCATITHFVLTDVNTTAGFRFIREHPTETVELRRKALQLVVDWTDMCRQNLSILDFTSIILMDCVSVFTVLTQLQGLACDEILPRTDVLVIDDDLRTKAKECLPFLETPEVWANVAGKTLYKTRAEFDVKVHCLWGFLWPNSVLRPRGKEAIDEVLEDRSYLYWWACEATANGIQVEGPEAPCDAVPRDNLRVCGRCLAVRYCSPRHQAAHWLQHKPYCVKPTW